MSLSAKEKVENFVAYRCMDLEDARIPIFKGLCDRFQAMVGCSRLKGHMNGMMTNMDWNTRNGRIYSTFRFPDVATNSNCMKKLQQEWKARGWNVTCVHDTVNAATRKDDKDIVLYEHVPYDDGY
jgi:hypothetical protein